MDLSLDPENLNLTMSQYSNYLKKFVPIAKYVIDVTAEQPIAKLYASSTSMARMAEMIDEDDNAVDFFTDGGLIEMGYSKSTLNADGNVIKSETLMSMAGAEKKGER